MYKLLAFILITYFFASSSFAAPRAQSAEECVIAADMALVAQSLARERIEPSKAGAIMARIYDVSESERGEELMRSILAAAYVRNVAQGASFAQELYEACMSTQGNMDAILGRSL